MQFGLLRIGGKRLKDFRSNWAIYSTKLKFFNLICSYRFPIHNNYSQVKTMTSCQPWEYNESLEKLKRQ